MDIKADFKVQITNKAWQKIAGWRDATNLECSGMGLVRKKGNVFTIYDTFLPKQVCTFGHTELNGDAIAQMMMRCHKMDIPLEHFRLWWHTHATFGCFWSGEDSETASRLAGHAGEFFISIVTNHDNKYLARLDMYTPFHVTFDNIDVEFLDGAMPRNTDWKYQISQKVSEPPPVKHIWSNNQTFQGFTDWEEYDWRRDLKESHVIDTKTETWWEKEKREEEEKQMSFLNPDTPPDASVVKEHYEIPKPKWYLEFLERRKKREEAKQMTKDTGCVWVNHGGKMMKMDDYLKEVRVDE